MTRYYYRPWKDESLVSALHFMRCRIVRDGQDGLDHVDALLGQLGVDPGTLPMPQKVTKTFKRGELQRAVMIALRYGPMTGPQIAKVVLMQAPEITYANAYKRVYICLNALERRGAVRHEGVMWEIAISSAGGLSTLR